VLLRKNINQKSQKRLVGQLNRQFAELAGMRRVATALVTTYLASTDRLCISNAGHPRPLSYRATIRNWCSLSQKLGNVTALTTPPLGRDDETRYPTLELQLGRGDLLVFYTDALTEAADPEGRLLGESGLLEAARRLNLADDSPSRIGRRLLEAAANHRQGQP